MVMMNFDELELNHKNLNQLKRMMTERNITMVLKYAVGQTCYPNQASYCASSNSTEVGIDATGDRRLAIFETTKVDYMHKVNCKKVLAQALAAYLAGEKYWMDEADITAHNEKQADRHLQSVAEETIINRLGKDLVCFTSYEALCKEFGLDAQKLPPQFGLSLFRKHGLQRTRVHNEETDTNYYRYTIGMNIGAGMEPKIDIKGVWKATDGDDVLVCESLSQICRLLGIEETLSNKRELKAILENDKKRVTIRKHGKCTEYTIRIKGLTVKQE
jgi:predicted P-loop ATPase